VPKNKGEKKLNDFIPPPILRLDEETKAVVENPPSLLEGVEMVPRAKFPKLLRLNRSSKGAQAEGMTQAEMQR
jgi:hypothetical protein